MSAPRLRFREFVGSIWTNGLLGDLVNEKSTKFNPAKSENPLKCIELEHLSRGTGQLLGFTDTSNSKSIKNRFSKGDVLFGKLRPYLRKFLRPTFDGVCSTEIWVFKGEKLTNEYLYNLVQTNSFINAANQSTGSKMPRADWDVVSKFELHYPDVAEQQKISSFLSAIDKKISLLTKKHELLIQYKKGVMQKIFDQEIRFKEKDGKDFPKWNICTLNERVLSIGSGGTPRSTTAAYYNGGIPWVSIADMTEQGKYISKTKKTLSSEGLKNSSAKLFPVGTVLYAMYASIGECSLADIGASTSQAILGIQTKPSELNNEFLYHWLCSIKDRVILMGQQGTQSNLNLEIVKNFEMNLPSLPEQMVIKSFLNVLDENIRIYGKRVELIKQYKQGLLQQMFV